jgi:hypothetical protein
MMRSTDLLRSICPAAALLILCVTLLAVCPLLDAQTAATGALSGVVTDPSGASVPKAEVKVTNAATGETRTVQTQPDGSFVVPLLPAGEYRVTVSASGFDTVVLAGIRVTVSETARVPVALKVQSVTGVVEVSASVEMVQTDTSALGRVADQRVVESLPLVTRNYTQIIGLSPGITTDATNAADLGRGSGSLSGTTSGGTFVRGGRSYDNNFQMNGLGINDAWSQGSISGGVAVPNPDTIQEFKVQTGQYDASFGRNAGANVNLVTRGGTNEFHGTLFEFFRNNALNANDFFSNRTGRAKPVLNQNQFGGTIGGPVMKNRLFFFGSYQGTRQVNGVASVRTVLGPPLTDERSAAALGRLFAGQRGQLQNAMGGVGPAILADGSNINPIALKLFQLKLPNGSYVVPTPQLINPSASFASRGISTFSTPSRFTENQYMSNIDGLIGANHRLSGRFFEALSDQKVEFPAANVPGFPNNSGNLFVVSSLAHSWTISPAMFNEARVGYNRTRTTTTQTTPFTFSSLGITSAPQNDDLPIFNISGSYNLATAAIGQRAQNLFLFEDSLSWVAGRHTLRLGGGLTRIRRNFTRFRQPGQLIFLSFPDLLLGLDRAANGTNVFSNIYGAVDLTGLFDRAARSWEAASYFQDDFRVNSRLTLNLGLRWEVATPYADVLGRASNLYIGLLNPNPPAAGTLEGIVVAGNFPGEVPAGVTRVNNNSSLNGTGASTFGPRIGFAYKLLPKSSRFVLRGGVGTYYSRYTGQAQTQTTTTQPYGLLRVVTGPPNGAATLANPFASPIPTPASFPMFVKYTPSTAFSQNAVDPDLRPGKVYQFSLNLQTELGRNLLLEVGYAGTRGIRLLRIRSVNQALWASSSNPVRGLTTNTVANVQQRVPYLGWSSSALQRVESAGGMWYSGLDVSLTKRFSSGLQFLASYTFSKTLDTDGANTMANANAGSAYGDQNRDRLRYGPASFSRPHRFIVSYIYELPWFKSSSGITNAVLAGWGISGVTLIQTGQPLTFFATNANNAYGISNDRAQLAPGCTYDQLLAPGGARSKITAYFNRNCFATAPAIGADGTATGFGNSGVGVVSGPGQTNFDFSVVKQFRPLTEALRVQFRAEFFNAFNTPQFANPDTTFTNSSFGQITSTSVNPRIVQLALKLLF